MRLSSIALCAITALSLFASATWSLPGLHERRQDSSDLEVSGALANLPAESTRYISRDELLAMLQVSFTVTADSNFAGPTKVSGVPLEELVRRLASSSASDMVVAICDDGYRANYPRAYLTAHHPLLVLEVNGQPPSGWPKFAEDRTSGMGPYMISNPKFSAQFQDSLGTST